jgi:hypothetical protein
MHDTFPADAARLASSDQPVLAILTIDDDHMQFRGNRQNFADLIQTGTEMGIPTYVVTVKDLKLNAHSVIGYTYLLREGRWVQDRFPRPTIIYNRIPLREDEQLPHVRRKLAAIARHTGIQMFNRRFFNKWMLFQWLHRDPKTRKFVPHTVKLTGIDSLARQLKRYRLLYLKPVRGKAGVGIMKVHFQPGKQLPFKLQVQEDKGSSSYRFATMERLWERIENVSQQIGEPYIVQQGIPLLMFKDRPFDLRVLVQKNLAGRWELTGIGARVAGLSSITTHVPRGGNIDKPAKLLNAIFGQTKAAKVLDEVAQTALVLARQIERKSGSPLGEMSLDLGIDHNGQIWFLEANSKPMKFDESDIRKQSLQRIFQYARFLHRRHRKAEGD